MDLLYFRLPCLLPLSELKIGIDYANWLVKESYKLVQYIDKQATSELSNLIVLQLFYGFV